MEQNIVLFYGLAQNPVWCTDAGMFGSPLVSDVRVATASRRVRLPRVRQATFGDPACAPWSAATLTPPAAGCPQHLRAAAAGEVHGGHARQPHPLG
jgi:hypothetical protein